MKNNIKTRVVYITYEKQYYNKSSFITDEKQYYNKSSFITYQKQY